MRNPTFSRAIQSLAHPICIVSILLLLVNDHYLKWHYANWTTGKISDVAWLVFAPLMLIALLAWIFPRKPNRAALLAFCGVGLIFAGAKTIPAMNDTVRTVQAALIGAETVDMRRDPTDLIALPALLVGWQIWRQSEQPLSVRRGLVALMIAIPATLATSPGPIDLGINCMVIQDGKIYALAIDGYDVYPLGSYASSDSGMTWQSNYIVDFDPVQQKGNCNTTEHLWQRTSSYGQDSFERYHPAQNRIMYRFEPGEVIYRSTNGGQSWQRDFELAYIGSEARLAYYGRMKPFVEYIPGPLDAVIDPNTGNVIVAMGHDGVLVRTDADGWQWVAIEERYSYQPATDINTLSSWLWPEVVQAIGLILMVLTCSIIFYRGKFCQMLLLAPGFTFWLISILWFFGSPRASFGFGIWGNTFFLILVFLFLIPLLWALLVEAYFVNDIRFALQTFAFALGIGIAYTLPLYLWSQNRIADYRIAQMLALLTIPAAMGYCFYVYINSPQGLESYQKSTRSSHEES